MLETGLTILLRKINEKTAFGGLLEHKNQRTNIRYRSRAHSPSELTVPDPPIPQVLSQLRLACELSTHRQIGRDFTRVYMELAKPLIIEFNTCIVYRIHTLYYYHPYI